MALAYIYIINQLTNTEKELIPASSGEEGPVVGTFLGGSGGGAKEEIKTTVNYPGEK